MDDESGVEQQPNTVDAEQTQQQKMADIDNFLQGTTDNGQGEYVGVSNNKSDGLSAGSGSENLRGEVGGEQKRASPEGKKEGRTKEEGEGEGGEGEGEEDEVTIDLEEKKRRLELYKQTVNMPSDEESLTVGELKDQVLEHRRTVQSVVDRENDVMRQFDHLMTIKNNMPQMTSEQLQAVNEFQLVHTRKERAMLLTAIPDWSNQQTFEADRSSMVSMLQDYGITEGDLSAVTDHRLIKLAYDFDRLKKRLSTASQSNKDALKKAGDSRKTSTGKGRGHKQPTSKNADFDSTKRSVNVADQMQQVDALFAGLK